jgi:hypothetical protein
MLRISHCLDNRLTDGGKVVSPTRRPLLYSPETLFLCLWYSFLLEKSSPPETATFFNKPFCPQLKGKQAYLFPRVRICIWVTNMEFWEALTAYFPLTLHGRTENNTNNYFCSGTMFTKQLTNSHVCRQIRITSLWPC